MRWEEAHFLGGPLDGEVRMIEYVRSSTVPHRVPVPHQEPVHNGWTGLQRPCEGATFREESYFKVWEGPADRLGRKHTRAILVHSEWE